MKNSLGKYPGSLYIMDEQADSSNIQEREYTFKSEMVNGLFASDAHVKLHHEDERKMHFGIVHLRVNNALWLKPINFIHDCIKDKIYLIHNDLYEHEVYNDELIEKINNVAKSYIARAMSEIEKAMLQPKT
ncbi:MAG: hypothetical protein LBC75_11980 [Fibromonadaceae bacterium]|jgi:hypothetical protein|nr:hypothetical protein [Fibromonadaceae bacterium]